MVAWATGRRALALCDQCGKSMLYLGLKKNISAQRPTGLLVCEDCNDKDNPQLMLGRFKVDDPIALLQGRPDWPHTQGLAGYNPVTGLNIDFRTGGAFAAPPRNAAPVEDDIGFSISGVGLYININGGVVEAGAI